MSPNLHISDFLNPISLAEISQDQGYKDGQIGKLIDAYDETFPDLYESDLILVGCEEERGIGRDRRESGGPEAIREQFYQLYYWHPDIRLADAGNIRSGATLNDTYAALKTVLRELTGIGKTVVILGGSHDLTLAQYYTYSDKKHIIEATCVDALIDLDIESRHRSENFLMEMLTGEPNYIHHYNHIGFQSYYVHPHMLETMDKLRFDCFRLGSVKDSIEEMEPVIRNSHLFSFDISAMAHSFAPANQLSPNGFNGEEACILMRYAGLSPNVNTVGIYGYIKGRDQGTADRQTDQPHALVPDRREEQGAQGGRAVGPGLLYRVPYGLCRGGDDLSPEQEDPALVDAAAGQQIHRLFVQGLRAGEQQRDPREMAEGAGEGVDRPYIHQGWYI
ncbi:arginase family protein [Puia sp. P3]|uniref:arginase family protein n=1 Tax=Puia sp. P3 TaxID=3423952 RepID=UPI003D6769CB